MKEKEQYNLTEEMETMAELAKANPCHMSPESQANMARTVHNALEFMKFFNFKNTSEFLHVDQRTVRRFVESGKLHKPRRGGDKILSFSTHDVLELGRKRDEEPKNSRKK